jgi:hypothetical protein
VSRAQRRFSRLPTTPAEPVYLHRKIDHDSEPSEQPRADQQLDSPKRGPRNRSAGPNHWSSREANGWRQHACDSSPLSIMVYGLVGLPALLGSPQVKWTLAKLAIPNASAGGQRRITTCPRHKSDWPGSHGHPAR